MKSGSTTEKANDQNARELEARAVEDYEKVRGKKVRVSRLLGYTNRDLSEEVHGDFLVRVDETPRQDVLRWMYDWLDPVYNVTVLEANGLPLEETGLAMFNRSRNSPNASGPLRSCWIDGRSYRLGLGHETQPGAIVAETNEVPELARAQLEELAIRAKNTVVDANLRLRIIDAAAENLRSGIPHFDYAIDSDCLINDNEDSGYWVTCRVFVHRWPKVI